MKKVDYCNRVSEKKIVLLGNFDGVHKGHQKLISKAIELKDISGGRQNTMALTFEPHPRTFFQSNFLPMQTITEKVNLLKGYGVDLVKVIKFDSSVAKLNPRDFFSKFILSINCSNVIVGSDFRFAYNREGDVNILEKLCQENDISLVEIKRENDLYSSTILRQAWEEGNIKTFYEIAGHYPFLMGVVEYGNQIGRTIGFPTANICMEGRFLPKKGVYSCYVKVKGSDYLGIANIGNRPTVNATKPVLEVHIFDFNENIYGQTLEITISNFVREERKFSGLDELKEQIKIDCRIVKNFI